MARIRTDQFGSNQGQAFGMQYPASLGVRHGDVIDALLLNNSTYGQSTGVAGKEYELGQDEYWSLFEIHNTGEISYLKIGSNLGATIEGGLDRSPGPLAKNPPVSGVRILQLGGYFSNHLNNIQIQYVENYIASKIVEDDADAVLQFRPGKVTITTYAEDNIKITEAYKRMTENSVKVAMNASAEGEYYVTFKVSTGLEVNSVTRTEIERTAERALKTARTEVEEIAQGEVAILVGRIRIMQDSDGQHWSYPIKEPEWIRLKSGHFGSLVGLYDFTSGIEQQTGLKHKSKFGFRVLSQ